MFGILRRLIQRYGFFKREPERLVGFLTPSGASTCVPWEESPFFTAHKAKNERLAQIARERDALKLALTKAKRDKKARAPIYAKLRALSVEELRVETGK